MIYIKTMRLNFFIPLLLFIGFAYQTYSQNTAIGNWKRIDKPTYQAVKIGSVNWGNLEIHADSSFRIEGDTTIKNPTKKGWIVGDEITGTWKIVNGDHIFFWINQEKDWFPLGYEIIKLNRKELILRSPSDNNNKFDMKYLRF